MDKPKTMYPQSEARRLRDQPCPHCGAMGRIERNRQDDLGGSKLDPDVSVTWRCPDKVCHGHDGFWVESE